MPSTTGFTYQPPHRDFDGETLLAKLSGDKVNALIDDNQPVKKSKSGQKPDKKANSAHKLYKLVSNPSASRPDQERNLDDVFVDLQSAKQLFPGYSDENLIAMCMQAPPVGSAPACATGATTAGGAMTPQYVGAPFTPGYPGGPCFGPANPQIVGGDNTGGSYWPMITEMVVNLDGNPQYGGWTDPITSLPFPTVAYLCEAQRGNLNSVANMTNAGVNLVPAATPDPRYFNTYLTQALLNVQPYNAEVDSVIEYVQELYRMSNTHFGLVTYNGTIGTDPSSTLTKPFLSIYYPLAGNYSIPQPLIPLNPAAGVAASNYATEIASLQNLLTASGYGRAATATALHRALDEFDPGVNNHARFGARRRITLVAVGVPSNDEAGNFDTVAAAADCITEATRANTLGVGIDCIVLCLGDIAPCDAVYNDTTGIAGISGHGARYWRIDCGGPSTIQGWVTLALNNAARGMVSNPAPH
jgi:hypothetical protein